MDALDEALAAAGPPPKASRQAAPAPAPAPARDPLDDALEAAGPAPSSPVAAPPPPAQAAPPQPSLLQQAGKSFADFGTGLYNTARSASEAIGNAVAHPIDTARAIADHPAAAARELGRGINDNIPFANRIVSALPGGAPAESPEDSALFPRARALGQAAGVPVADMAGQVAGKALGALGEKASAIAQRREDAGVYQDLGRSASGARAAKLKDVGPEQIAKVDREFGISEAPNPPAAVKQALRQVGQVRDQAFQTIAPVDMGTVAKRLDDLQADFASRATTRESAAEVATLRGKLLQQYGGTGQVPAKALADEISALSEGAYGTNYQNPKTAQIVQRRMAGALRDVQAENFDAVAKLGPDEAAAVQTARAANQKFEALKTMEPIVKAKAVKAEFAPGFVDNALDQGVIKTVGHAAKDAAVGSVNNAISGVGNVATAAGRALSAPPAAALRPTVGPAQVARLVQLARDGASRQQLVMQAQQDGTPPEIAANIAQQYASR